MLHLLLRLPQIPWLLMLDERWTTNTFDTNDELLEVVPFGMNFEGFASLLTIRGFAFLIDINL